MMDDKYVCSAKDEQQKGQRHEKVRDTGHSGRREGGQAQEGPVHPSDRDASKGQK